MEVKQIRDIILRDIYDSNGYGINNDKWERSRAAAQHIYEQLQALNIGAEKIH